MKIVAISSSTRRFSITISRHGNVVHGFGCVCGGLIVGSELFGLTLGREDRSREFRVESKREKSCGY